MIGFGIVDRSEVFMPFVLFETNVGDDVVAEDQREGWKYGVLLHRSR